MSRPFLLTSGPNEESNMKYSWEHKEEFVQQREGLRHEILSKVMKEHGDRQARPVTVFPNFDKLSGAWLLALPGPKTGLSTAVVLNNLL